MSFRIERGHLLPTTPTKVNNHQNIGTDFKKVLDETTKTKNPIKISGHAQQRMIERGISLQEQDMNLISQGMDKLEEKGAKESLMLYKDMAFIASINNRTIITAMGNREMEVVTNIDSAILIK
ncbi:MAG: TIGR02530 family flagellar biosynthesis protein [Tissierellaceae bacterium]|nr:TIGR02530 family flagellar biosynthesis protein [Tissierellaceae bacterium]